MSSKLFSDIPFARFQLPAVVQQGLDETKLTCCTMIQAQTLPIALEGNDVAGQAQTGTGKTAAFLVVLFTWLLKQPAPEKRKINQPRAIIIAPTRELAIQIHQDAQQLGRYTSFRMALVYGGTDYLKQRKQLESGVDILIGTPGRVIDYFKQGVFDLKAIQIMILDEADRMFDLGFIKDIRYLLRRMPKPERRLSMLFSATLSWRVMELAYEHMNNPQLIKIETDKITSDKVRQTIYYPSNSEKIPLLLGLIKQHNPQRTMIFVNTKRSAERVTAYLQGNGHKTALLSGDVPQRKRQSLLQGFQSGDYPFLVATDVASRGLHIPEVSHIINFDLPQSEEDYVHRIGRTARVGAEGDAISFACEDYAFYLPAIEKYIGHKIPASAIDPQLLLTPKPPTRRKSKKKARSTAAASHKRPHNRRHKHTRKGSSKPQRK
ncbi:MAG: ATP-dependent RNA helicase RhlB [Gammaproteobacteria bacterium]|nr:ATP-dependent RNA helicase RhlB [Gammaproteobacteria bacterium]